MSQVSFGVKNARRFFKALEKEGKKAQKAAVTAQKVEGYRLMRLLKTEIKTGAPGGRRFAPLSVMGQYSARPYNRTAYRKLAMAVRYDVQAGRRGQSFRFGFLSKRSSKSWMKIAARAQGGAINMVTKKQRRHLARWGSTLNIGSRLTGDSRYFYLRRTTHALLTPARPIIDPFWQAHERAAAANIQRNYYRKLRGERI